MQQLDLILEQFKAPMLSTLQEWLRIPSLLAEAQPGAPFGPELRRMLDKALADCRALGLKTENLDGYIGHADMGEGPDEEALAILAHLDVVPVGDGWTKEPFGAQVVDGRLYGRGSSDDKGPAVAALYAMAAVLQAGIPLRRKVRLILGCDEESGMGDIEHYKKVAHLPREGFSPDASYPVINIEKGMLALRLSAPVASEGLKVLRFRVGERQNVVPGAAEATIEGGEKTAELAREIAKRHGWPLTAEQSAGQVRLRTEGINGHAAFPEQARNAIGQMLVILSELGAKTPYDRLAEALGLQYDGASLGIAMRDEISGALTCNLGIIELSGDTVHATLDLRCPILCDLDKVQRQIEGALPGFRVERLLTKEPHHVPENSALVQALLSAYHEVTGLPRKTLAIGGGTYARTLREGVAFGAQFPGEPDLAHQADEHITLESLYRNLRIFAYAIVKLVGA